MRIKLRFELENPNLDIQYRKAIISFLKHAIEAYDKQLFEDLYASNKMKTFCFGTILPHPIFHEERIQLQDTSFSIIFSFYNYVYALHIYNSLLSQKFKSYSLDKNSMTLNHITVIPEKQIVSNNVNIKMISPIICRNHNRDTKKDWYYSYEKEEFSQYIRINISEQLRSEGIDTSLLDGFQITPIKGKKTIIKLYEKQIEASLGTFQLQGDKKLLEFLYKSGMGAKRSMGFGLFEIV